MGTSETRLGTPAPTVEAKTVIGGRYRVERLLGGGGCGLVYAARHEILGKPVAIKIMRSELVRDTSQAQRFFREAKLAATLHHENIVDITDFGNDDAGAPYLVMELLRGRTLMDVVREAGVLPWPRAVGILLQLARALACAHGQGVLHRDIKPHNIMVEEGSGRSDRVKLCDFGLSRLRSGDDRITSTGNFVGTPAYMAPEQIRGTAQDERCDIYALGVTGYEMLTGSLPYRATTPVALVAEILGDDRIGIRDRVDAEIPEALVALIERCLAVDPEARPASVADIEQELMLIAALPTRAIADLVGEVVGSYRVIAPLGTGGSGSVWLAEHPVIGTKVAIKVLRPEVAALPGVAERFVNEARAASIIGSPHIVRYLDLGWLTSGQPYAILEYLDGETVYERLGRLVRFPVTEVVQIARQLAGALVQAHGAGIVHRDIKPENVFLSDTDQGVMAKVLDFGIAKLSGSITDSGPKTQVGFFMGTVAYCPPEQLLGDDVGAPADVYALGATMFDMLVGHAPFTGDATQVASAKTTRTAPPVRDARADVPRHIASLVDAMLAMSPQQRPTMAQVVQRLSSAPSAEEPRPVVAAAASSTLEIQPSARRFAIPAGVVIAALALLTYLVWPGGSNDASAPKPVAKPHVTVEPIEPAPSATKQPARPVSPSATAEPAKPPPTVVDPPVKPPEPPKPPVPAEPPKQRPTAAVVRTPPKQPVISPPPPKQPQPATVPKQPAPPTTPPPAKQPGDVIIADPFKS